MRLKATTTGNHAILLKGKPLNSLIAELLKMYRTLDLADSIHKMAPEINLRFTTEKVIFALNRMEGPRGEFMICAVGVQQLFPVVYDMIGLRPDVPEANQVVVVVKTDSLSRALKNVNAATQLTLKLTGKGRTGAQFEVTIEQVLPLLRMFIKWSHGCNRSVRIAGNQELCIRMSRSNCLPRVDGQNSRRPDCPMLT